jgi:hypothetical protein
MARVLYLHEVIDIVGQQSATYMADSVLGFKAETAADRGLALFGTWEVVGATGRWPQVVNVWELVDGWDGWERLCRSTNLNKAVNTELGEWWQAAYARRTGGFDRLMGAAPGCPTLAELTGAGVRGEWFVHELTTVPPGGAADYLRAVHDERAPALTDHGHELVGLWEVLGGDTEVCVLWATSLDAHVALAKAEDAVRGFGPADGDVAAGAAVDGRLAAWPSRRRELTVRWHEELLVPAPGTPLAI